MGTGRIKRKERLSIGPRGEREAKEKIPKKGRTIPNVPEGEEKSQSLPKEVPSSEASKKKRENCAELGEGSSRKKKKKERMASRPILKVPDQEKVCAKQEEGPVQ